MGFQREREEDDSSTESQYGSPALKVDMSRPPSSSSSSSSPPSSVMDVHTNGANTSQYENIADNDRCGKMGYLDIIPAEDWNKPVFPHCVCVLGKNDGCRFHTATNLYEDMGETTKREDTPPRVHHNPSYISTPVKADRPERPPLDHNTNIRRKRDHKEMTPTAEESKPCPCDAGAYKMCEFHNIKVPRMSDDYTYSGEDESIVDTTSFAHISKPDKIHQILHKNRTSLGAHHEIIVERCTGNAHPHTPSVVIKKHYYNDRSKCITMYRNDFVTVVDKLGDLLENNNKYTAKREIELTGSERRKKYSKIVLEFKRWSNADASATDEIYVSIRYFFSRPNTPRVYEPGVNGVCVRLSTAFHLLAVSDGVIARMLLMTRVANMIQSTAACISVDLRKLTQGNASTRQDLEKNLQVYEEYLRNKMSLERLSELVQEECSRNIPMRNFLTDFTILELYEYLKSSAGIQDVLQPYRGHY